MVASQVLHSEFEDELMEPDLPEDGRQAWISLLAIGMIAAVSTVLLYVIVSLIPI